MYSSPSYGPIKLQSYFFFLLNFHFSLKKKQKKKCQASKISFPNNVDGMLD